jgi:fluoride exporter
MIVAVALLAGAVGAVLRWGVSRAFAKQRFPWAVLVVNVVGSALGGVLVGLAVDDAARVILLTGFCGGLTTFSTLSVETVQLVLGGRTRTAALSMLVNLVVGIGAAVAGWAIASALG